MSAGNKISVDAVPLPKRHRVDAIPVSMVLMRCRKIVPKEAIEKDCRSRDAPFPVKMKSGARITTGRKNFFCVLELL
jgi:hypothetical protein